MMQASIPEFLQPVIAALCSTIAYSLWQGALLAAAVGLILLWTRNKPAVIRYNLLLASFSVFAVASFYTFVSGVLYLVNSSATSIPHATVTLPFLKANNSVAIGSVFFFEKISFFLNEHALPIVCLWFVVVSLRSLQFAFGMRNVFTIRYKNAAPAAMLWQQRICELGNTMGIHKIVKVLDSGVAKAPMVVGHFKPLILIPAGMLTGLPQAEIESILIHELAHIRRNDYLVNILQSLLEILFFFNPAVLWTSSLIKKEREHCCDDITIKTAGSKLVYIKALVSSQEYVQHAPVYAIALARKKKHLLSRVKRLAFNDRKPFTGLEKAFLATCILVAILLVTVFSFGDKKLHKSITASNTISIVTHDEVVASKKSGLKKNRQRNTAVVVKDTTAKKIKVNVIKAPDVKVEKLVTTSVSATVSTKDLSVACAVSPHAPMAPKGDVYNSKQLIQELLNDHIIESQEEDFSFKLSTSEFVVNGVKQPEQIYNRYKIKYLKIAANSEVTWCYNYNTSS